jgi:DNA-binding transcriptional regulator YiaG
MTRLSLKEQFGRLEQIQGEPPVRSGLPGDVEISLPEGSRTFWSISAIKALKRRHASLRLAKAEIERAMRGETVIVSLPMIEDEETLLSELRSYGFRAAMRRVPETDLVALRETLGLSQEAFALRFNLDVDAIRNWEQGRRKPDRAAQNYLRVIATSPDAVMNALSSGK